jgi:cytochrome c biogenesis protein CcmG, thiol:disulfide interchange protein DsbE
MYKLLISTLLIGLINIGNCQTAVRKLPEVPLKTLDGNTVSSSSFLNQEGLTVVSFWATWCKPCVLELNNIKELYSDWKRETKVKIVAISIDDSRNTAKVGPMVNGKGWEYQILLDTNGDFKRALNVNNVPHTFLINQKGEIIWQHSSYAPGDEEELYEIIKKNSPKP